MNKVMVIAAHPDDEILGCGATIAKHIQAQDRVRIHILAEGITSRGTSDAEEILALRASALEANKCLGVKDVHLHNFPDNAMDTLPRLEVIKYVEQIVHDFKPDIIYTHHAGDVNIDHQRIHEAVVTATRPMPNEPKPVLLFFEVMSSTEWQIAGSAPHFKPNWYVDVSATIGAKLEALAKYDSEMRPWPHARSIHALEHLAHWRGSNIGVEAAEAFMLGRKVA